MSDPGKGYIYRFRGQHPKQLRGNFDQRVFVGGHYDFMPTLRFIADCVSEVTSVNGDSFIPIIPYFHRIDPHNVMEEDRQMVRECARAIFDTSDLGGQLIEMEEMLRLNRPTLVVYPVREDSDLDPERGRLTITTCGHPFTSYAALDELKEKIRVFLLGLTEPRGYVLREISDEEQESALYRIHSMVRDMRHDDARKAIDEMNSQGSEGVLDAWLALALIEQRSGNLAGVQRALRSASALSADDHDKAEIAYYRGLVAAEQKHWEKVTKECRRAEKLKPEDPRILVACGYGYRRRGGARHLKTAFKYMENALQAAEKQPTPDREIQQRMVALIKMHAINNLAYYCYELAEKEQDGRKKTKFAERALTLSRDLPTYHRRFRRRNAAWLHTPGCALLLNARLQKNLGMLEDAKTILGHARAMGRDERVEESWQNALELTDDLESSKPRVL